MRLRLVVLAVLAGVCASGAGSGTAKAQTSTATKSQAPKAAPATGAPAKPSAHVAGSYGHWTLLCGKEENDTSPGERCSLVLPLLEKESEKLIFRVILTDGPEGRLVLRVDGPTGVALQRGVEFATDSGARYRMPFQTCLPMGCKAFMLAPDDLRQQLIKSKQATIIVYALNGKAIQTIADIDGMAAGLKAFDEMRKGAAPAPKP